MINFELIDDYLANRLKEQDKRAFELQLQGDPSLREEVEFQKLVVEGVRKARAIELKTMLQNVPLSGSSWSGGQIAAGVVSVGLAATLLYLYMNKDPQAITPAEKQQQEIVITPDSNLKEPINSAAAETKEEKSGALSGKKEKAKLTDEGNVTTPVNKPDIQPVDPSEEFSEAKSNDVNIPGHTEISTSKMEVITGLSDKKHNFHYQFVQGKLMLYGSFDKSLYEILEINGEGHAVFLFYKENYYLLDEKQVKITMLEAIRNGQLLKKLKEYRGR